MSKKKKKEVKNRLIKILELNPIFVDQTKSEVSDFLITLFNTSGKRESAQLKLTIRDENEDEILFHTEDVELGPNSESEFKINLEIPLINQIAFQVRLEVFKGSQVIHATNWAPVFDSLATEELEPSSVKKEEQTEEEITKPIELPLDEKKTEQVEITIEKEPEPPEEQQVEEVTEEIEIEAKEQIKQTPPPVTKELPPKPTPVITEKEEDIPFSEEETDQIDISSVKMKENLKQPKEFSVQPEEISFEDTPTEINLDEMEKPEKHPPDTNLKDKKELTPHETVEDYDIKSFKSSWGLVIEEDETQHFDETKSTLPEPEEPRVTIEEKGNVLSEKFKKEKEKEKEKVKKPPEPEPEPIPEPKPTPKPEPIKKAPVKKTAEPEKVKPEKMIPEKKEEIPVAEITPAPEPEKKEDKLPEFKVEIKPEELKEEPVTPEKKTPIVKEEKEPVMPIAKTASKEEVPTISDEDKKEITIEELRAEMLKEEEEEDIPIYGMAEEEFYDAETKTDLLTGKNLVEEQVVEEPEPISEEEEEPELVGVGVKTEREPQYKPAGPRKKTKKRLLSKKGVRNFIYIFMSISISLIVIFVVFNPFGNQQPYVIMDDNNSKPNPTPDNETPPNPNNNSNNNLNNNNSTDIEIDISDDINELLDSEIVDESFWIIEVATFSDKNEAQKTLTKIKKLGYDPVIEKIGTKFAVMIKHIKEEKTDAIIKKLEGLGYTPSKEPEIDF